MEYIGTTMAMLNDGKDCLDKKYKELCAEEWAKGGSFFLYMSDNPTALASCCRVLNEMHDNTFSSTIGMTGVMTGSANVITLNINRIVQDCNKNYGLFRNGGWKENTSYICDCLKEVLERVYKYHIAYKSMLYDIEDKGMITFSNANYLYLKKLYSTIGIIGYVEAAKFLGLDISPNEDYFRFLQLILGTIKEENKKHSIHDKKRPFLFNSEAIPGESLAVKLYKADKEDGYYVPEDQNLYSSYFFRQWDHISTLDKLRLHGEKVNRYCDGGQACHLSLDTHLSKEQYIKLIDFAIGEGVNYFTFNIPMSECNDCKHVVNAPITECPICHSKHISYYTRIIGYLTKVDNWSKDRQIEFTKRIFNNGNKDLENT